MDHTNDSVLQHAVAAFPKWSAHDAAEIERVRAAHDPRAAVVRAHFTLVFPLVVPVRELDGIVRDVVREQRAFDVELARAVVHRDAGTTSSHVFLVPSAGAAEIAELHALLYGGVLAVQLRRDLPFVPHVTVAQASEAECESVASAWNAGARALRGRIEELEIVAIDGASIRSIAQVPLR